MSKILIGIDPGTKTGVAFYQDGKLTELHTCRILIAFNEIFEKVFLAQKQAHLYIENPNTWKRFKGNKDSHARAQGAGSVKRDYAIWVEFCEYHKIPYTPVSVRGNLKKLTKEQFAKVTGYKGPSSVHSRDAGMMVWGR
jgi:hypothetical protein